MTYKTALCTAALAVCAAAPAFAQTTPARPATAPAAAATPRPASAPTNPGPVIPGVCVLDGEQAIGTSAAGRAAAARLTVLRQQVQAELAPEDTALRNEATRIRALPEAQRAAPAQAYQTRGAALQQLAGRRQAELERTEYNALLRINTELSAVVSQIYVQRGCGLMLSKSAIVYANPAMDVTAAAVTALNARMPTITFNRETLPAQPAGGAAQR
jgi:outer membrane protein